MCGRTGTYINFDPKWIKKGLAPLEKPLRMTEMCISLMCMSVIQQPIKI
jgi:hypothetical protein